jgi:oligosaccharide repeat unit polymerase
MSDMFYYVLFSIIIFSVLLSWIKSERIINPVSVFVIWWGGFLYLSTFKLIGMRLPSENTYFLVMTSIAMFSLGGITYLKAPLDKIKSMTVKKKFQFGSKLRYFFYFQLFCTIILLYYLSKSYAMLKTMDPGVYRNMLFTEFSIFGSFKILIIYVIEPSLYVSALISMTGIFIYKFPNSLVALSVFNLALYSAVTLGRAPIFIAILCIIITFLFAVSEEKIKLKLKHIVFMMLPVLFIAWLSMFRRRTFDLKAILILRDYFIWYLTGPFTALELFRDNYIQGYDWDYSYVRGLFAGIEEILSPLTKKIFIGYVPINESFHEITKVFRSLGGKAISHNSHYTMLYEFMRDAGIYGVIIFSYMLGTLNAFLYNIYRDKTDIKSFSLMVIIIYLSLMGITRWELRYTWSWLTIFGIIFFTRKFVLTKRSV